MSAISVAEVALHRRRQQSCTPGVMFVPAPHYSSKQAYPPFLSISPSLVFMSFSPTRRRTTRPLLLSFQSRENVVAKEWKHTLPQLQQQLRLLSHGFDNRRFWLTGIQPTLFSSVSALIVYESLITSYSITAIYISLGNQFRLLFGIFLTQVESIHYTTLPAAATAAACCRRPKPLTNRASSIPNFFGHKYRRTSSSVKRSSGVVKSRLI